MPPSAPPSDRPVHSCSSQSCTNRREYHGVLHNTLQVNHVASEGTLGSVQRQRRTPPSASQSDRPVHSPSQSYTYR